MILHMTMITLYRTHHWLVVALISKQHCDELPVNRTLQQHVQQSRVADSLRNKRVCVEPPPSALNTTLPAFAAKRTRLQLSTDICRKRAQQQINRTPLLLLIDGTDGRTDGRTDTRPLHRPCMLGMRAASISDKQRLTITTVSTDIVRAQYWQMTVQ